MFIGREQIVESFLNVLVNTDKTGTYLVTGFRGMGKTSFVNRVLGKYKEKKLREGTDEYDKIVEGRTK